MPELSWRESYQLQLTGMPARPQRPVIDTLRNRDMVTLSLVAVQADQIAGDIAFSPVTVESEYSSFEAIALALIAVLSAYQRKGIGSPLVALANSHPETDFVLLHLIALEVVAKYAYSLRNIYYDISPYSYISERIL